MRHLLWHIIFLAFFLTGPVQILYSQSSFIPEDKGMEPLSTSLTAQDSSPAPVDTASSFVLERIGGVYRFNFFRRPWIRRWHVAGLRGDFQFKNNPLIASLNYGT